jgi:hypothetical protein
MHLIPVMRHHPKFHAHEPRTACSLNSFPNIVQCWSTRMLALSFRVAVVVGRVGGRIRQREQNFGSGVRKGFFSPTLHRPLTFVPRLCICVCGAKMLESAFSSLIFIIDNKPSESSFLPTVTFSSCWTSCSCVFSRASNHSR